MSLKEDLNSFIGSKRKFLLLRVAGIDSSTARKLCKVKQGTYNSWTKNEGFNTFYKQIGLLSCEFKEEAIRLLRKNTQLEAILLEGDIIKQMKAEVKSGKYDLIKTNLAKEVYNKLVTDLDIIEQPPATSWQDRVKQLFGDQPERLPERGTVDGEFTTIPTEQGEHTEGNATQESPQTVSEVEAEV